MKVTVRCSNCGGSVRVRFNTIQPRWVRNCKCRRPFIASPPEEQRRS